MYSIHISSVGCGVATPYIEFLAVRRRLQQLVVLHVHTWKYDWNSLVGDILLQQMKEAGSREKAEWFDGEWRSASTKGAELSLLDTSIIEEIGKDKGKIKIGSYPVHFLFHFELQPDGILYVHEEFEVSEEIKKQNAKFFSASNAAMNEAPPEYPMTNMERFLHA